MLFSLYIDFVSLYLFVITFLKVYDNEDEANSVKSSVIATKITQVSIKCLPQLNAY